MVRLAAIAISTYILYHLDSYNIWNVKGKKYRNRELKTRSSRILGISIKQKRTVERSRNLVS